MPVHLDYVWVGAGKVDIDGREARSEGRIAVELLHGLSVQHQKDMIYDAILQCQKKVAFEINRRRRATGPLP